MGDKGETSVNSCGPRNPGDKCGRQVGDKGGTSVNSCGPRHPEWEYKFTRPKAPRVGDKGDKCKLMRPKEPRVGDMGETSVNSQGTQSGRQAWETSVGDNVWETSGRQV